MTVKLLIVNADDFGACEDVNRGIVHAHQHGLVRSASLFVNMSAFEHAVECARALPGLEVGLHCNISSGACAADAAEVSLLADAGGKFLFDESDMPGSLARMRDAAGREGFARQVAAELRAQVRRFKLTGLRLGHINSHHYLSLLHQQLFEAHLRVAEEERVPLRGLCLPMMSLMCLPAEEVSLLTRRVCESSMPCPDVSLSNPWDTSGMRPSWEDYRARTEESLSELSTRDDIRSVEIVTHPADITPTLSASDGYAWARELESTLVTSEEFGAAVGRFGYKLGSYSDLLAGAQ